jgi:hypothetical protein
MVSQNDLRRFRFYQVLGQKLLFPGAEQRCGKHTIDVSAFFAPFRGIKMDEAIKKLEQQILHSVANDTFSRHERLAHLTSSYKDLCIARLLEDIRLGKVTLVPGRGGWYMGKIG